jgi:hypothetical protein
MNFIVLRKRDPAVSDVVIWASRTSYRRRS